MFLQETLAQIGNPKKTMMTTTLQRPVVKNLGTNPTFCSLCNTKVGFLGLKNLRSWTNSTASFVDSVCFLSYPKKRQTHICPPISLHTLQTKPNLPKSHKLDERVPIGIPEGYFSSWCLLYVCMPSLSVCLFASEQGWLVHPHKHKYKHTIHTYPDPFIQTCVQTKLASSLQQKRWIISFCTKLLARYRTKYN